MKYILSFICTILVFTHAHASIQAFGGGSWPQRGQGRQSSQQQQPQQQSQQQSQFRLPFLPCPQRSVRIGGRCQAVSDQCKTWNPFTGLCTSCYNGDYLRNGVCSFGQSGSQSQTYSWLCIRQDNRGRCLACINRAVLIRGSCKQVSDLCSTWSQTTGQCSSCYWGYNLRNGVCS